MESDEYLKKQLSIMINLFESKRFDILIDKGSMLIKKFPEQSIFYNITSLAYNAIGKSIEAKKLLTKVLKKDPENISVLNNLGLISVQCGDNDEAEEYYSKALDLNPGFLEVLVNLGNLKLGQDRGEEAKEFFLRALKIDNQLIPAKKSLAAYYEQSGKFEEAKGIYREILKKDPSYTIADKSLSLIHKYKLGDDHIKVMEEKLSNDSDEEGLKRLSFALGKAYEDVGNYEKSFRLYEAGNKLYSKEITYDLKVEINYIEKIKKIFEKNNIATLDDYGQKIIFILGMPRSGTTLAEQILSSHKNVYGAGELNYLKEAIEKNLLIENGGADLSAKNLKPEILKKIKDYYLKKIMVYKNEKEYLVDKAPLNFKWIGFILGIFPNSKIIHCSRNPMDVCWSNYKNTFASRSMNYTYDFNNLAGFYKTYDDLMQFWLKKFGKKVFNLVYENLIINKEIETKKMLNFCDLAWDDKCLDFHKNKKSVSTASLAQVRLPLYSSSVEKWKNYSKELDVLKKLLIN
jgi:tetratricopeptide (TPR) repeat protein